MGEKRIKKSKPTTTALAWHNPDMDWKKFQQISLFVYRQLNNDQNIEEYLKPGQKQAGIDLITLKNNNGKYICLQCKHYVTISLSELKTAVEEFTDEQFLRKTETFIITTSASLQDESLLSYLREQKLLLENDYGINFDWWDVHRMEGYLKNQFRLVQRFFSLREAKAYCFQSDLKKNVYAPFPDFLERHITNAKEVQEDEFTFNYPAQPRSTLTLASIFTQSYLTAQKICLIAEAYEGKSVLFEQTAYELSNIPAPYTVLLLRLKSGAVQPLDALLELHYDSWMAVPANDLVILVDGLDEVSSDKFLDMVDHINDFCIAHPFIHLGFSCRKLFFSSYDVEKRLNKFEYYNLIGLSYNQSLTYLSQHLGNNANNYFQGLNQMNLTNLLVSCHL